jgi:hypothetical protein
MEIWSLVSLFQNQNIQTMIKTLIKATALPELHENAIMGREIGCSDLSVPVQLGSLKTNVCIIPRRVSIDQDLHNANSPANIRQKSTVDN